MLKNQLIKLALPKNSVLVFAYLIGVTEAKATEIIKHTGVHRFLVYEALRDLVQRQLVKKVIKNNIAWFRVLNVAPLVKEAEERYQAAVQIAHFLTAQRRPEESSATFFQGVEGVHAFTEFVLKQNRPLLILGANARFAQFFPEIFTLWNERRKMQNMSMQALVPSGLEKVLLKNIPLFTYRIFDAKLFPGVLWIFGDYFAHLTWTTKETTEIIMIHNPVLAAQQLDFFRYIWKKSK